MKPPRPQPKATAPKRRRNKRPRARSKGTRGNDLVNDLPDFAVLRDMPLLPYGWHDQGWFVLADGRLGLVRVNRDFSAASARDQWLAWPSARLRLSCFDGAAEHDIIDVPAERWPMVDRLPDGRWVVASPRAEPAEENAQIFERDGSLGGRFRVGDGVEHIACSPDGLIWAGYFDEGVFGDADPDGSSPPASSGIAAFKPDGRCDWRFQHDDCAIADCYALSLAGATVWACPYTDFPIVRIRDGEIRIWTNETGSAHAICAGVGHVILAGSYGRDGARITLLRLEAEKAVPIAERTVTGLGRIQGRDGTLHAIVEERWVQISIADWLAVIDQASA